MGFIGFICLSGCTLGPTTLKTDQVDYARALGDAKKREILATLVGLRYGDPPGILRVSQIIAAYTFDATVGVTINSPADGSPKVVTPNTATFSNHPTFTFTPTSGEHLAKSYIHPLSPALILPLASSGIPIDLLLRISAQSIAGLSNSTLLGGATGDGSPDFFRLLHLLRKLQLAGQLSIHSQPSSESQAVTLSIGTREGHVPEAIINDIKEARALLSLTDYTSDYIIEYGNSPAGGPRISILTRSILGILTNLAAQIAVPETDIAKGMTTAPIELTGGETRPTIVVHCGSKSPRETYAAVSYRSSRFYIEDTDSDSKFAMMIVQTLMLLAEIDDNSKAPVLTIPAN